jgi:UDP-N-acetylmuramate--alanine ligase
MLKNRVRRLHFVGIGGSGMCGIAEVLLTLGYEVSGSDLKATEVTERLKKGGAVIFIGHAEANVHDAQVVVYSSAVEMDNPEMVSARRMGIPIIRRAEMLAELMRMKYGIGISGTHGKTTTTSMAGLVLDAAGLDPTVVIGGRLNSLGTHARLGSGEYMVVEADEAYGSFLFLSPVVAVITNVDDDHLDHYRSVVRLQAAFVEFSNKVPFYGSVIACVDDPGVRQILPEIHRRTVTYGLNPGAILYGEGLKLAPDSSSCRVRYDGRELGTLKLPVPGKHNVSNALAAVAVGLELDVPFDTAARALAAYTGVARRMQLKGEKAGIRVYDDYGHHPTEIRATLEAARQLISPAGGKLWVLFQPHRYSRVNLLRDSFGGAFETADHAVLTEIYAAGEVPIPGVTAQMILESVRRHGKPDVRFVPDLDSACSAVADGVRRGDVVLTMGAGDVNRCGDLILKLLEGRP